jgi:hypothetical protein
VAVMSFRLFNGVATPLAAQALRLAPADELQCQRNVAMWWQCPILDAHVRRNHETAELNVLLGCNKRRRIRAAVAVSLLYVVCILAPSAALALAEPGAAAHCLTESSLGAAHVHHERAAPNNDVHADGGAHIHSDAGMPDRHSDADGKSHGGNCCGLFCVTAMPYEPALALAVPPAAALVGLGQDYQLAGRGLDRINRPPIG